MFSTRKILTYIFLSFSLSANATTISHVGYTLNTETNIVTGGGIEWLQWDETVGLSIDDALTNYSSDGWRLASNAEVGALFRAFLDIPFDNYESTGQNYNLIEPQYSVSAANNFIEIFGDTYLAGGGTPPYWNGGDIYEKAAAYFGEDADQDGKYNHASIVDEYTNATGNYERGRADLNKDTVLATSSSATAGVALVRDMALPSPVPVPAAAWLFGSALLSLGLKCRK